MKIKLRLGQLSDKMGEKFLEISGKVLIIKLFEAPEEIEEIGDVTDQIKNAYFFPEQGMEGKLNFETVKNTNNNQVF